MRYFKSFFILIALLFMLEATAQETKDYKAYAIGFYNLENLFDLEDTPDKNDAEFLPDGSYNWTEKRYKEKQARMAHIISKLGKSVTKQSPLAFGLSEIETRIVLEDLIAQEDLKNIPYKIAHVEGPDRRGVDVAFIYNSAYLKVDKVSARDLRLQKTYAGENWEYKTRNQLIVEGELDGERVAFIVNHWPSRRAESWYREKAGELNRKIIDSLRNITPGLKVMTMGDLNDDPTNKSVKKSLGAVGKRKELTDESYLYNPFWSMYKKGLGTLAYRDSWNLFDQIILSKELVEDKNGLFFYKAEIENFPELKNKTGRYKGYPFRTYAGGNYQGGYSDHFPVVVYLLKEKK